MISDPRTKIDMPRQVYTGHAERQYTSIHTVTSTMRGIIGSRCPAHIRSCTHPSAADRGEGSHHATNGNRWLSGLHPAVSASGVFQRSTHYSHRPATSRGSRYLGGLDEVLSDLGNGHSEGAEMDWTDAWRDAFRTEVRAEAITLADHGWPVVPGSYPRSGHWVGMPSSSRSGAGQHASVPVHLNWTQLAGCGPERVAELWSGHPFSVLLATGMGVDALDLPAELGQATAIGLRVIDALVPIAATPTGRWLFPILGGGTLHHQLAHHPDVVLHARGGWVPLPPSPCLPGVVHWRVKPGMCGWELPRLDEVTDAVLAAFDEAPAGAR
jgi:hypothetical protein